MAATYKRVEVGTTVQFTWVGSTAPSSLTLEVKTSSETWVLSSTAAVSSGGGYFYSYGTIPDSLGKYPAYLMAIWTATASTHVGTASPFITRMVFEVIKTAPWTQPAGV